MRYHCLVSVALLLSAAACVSNMGWRQEGKTDDDEKRDSDDCRSRASKDCHDGSRYCVNEAFSECMRERGWHKGK